MATKKKLLVSLATILGIAILAIVITFVVLFSKGPRNYNEDGSILSVKNLDEVRIVLGDSAIYLKDDFVEHYASLSSASSYGVHFVGNLNSAELGKISVKYNKNADGYRVIFHSPNNIQNDGITYHELLIDYRRYTSVNNNMLDGYYTKFSTKNRASQGQGMTLISTNIEDKYGSLVLTAKLDIDDSVSTEEFESISSALIYEYENAIVEKV